MRRRAAFERLEVGDDLPGVVAEDRAAGDPEQGAKEEAARVAAEGALPLHLDPAATLRWRRGELPAAARVGVDVGAGHRRSDPAGLGPVVVASFPVDADASGVPSVASAVVSLSSWTVRCSARTADHTSMRSGPKS